MRAIYTTSVPRQGTKPLAWQGATAGSSAGVTMSEIESGPGLESGHDKSKSLTTGKHVG